VLRPYEYSAGTDTSHGSASLAGGAEQFSPVIGKTCRAGKLFPRAVARVIAGAQARRGANTLALRGIDRAPRLAAGRFRNGLRVMRLS